MFSNQFKVIIILLGFIFVFSCKKDPQIYHEFKTTPYNLDIPDLFQDKNIIEEMDNPMTEEGVLLGRMLFYDPILSKDSTISCSSCHNQNNSFTDEKKLSLGVDNKEGTRNSMHIVNALWSEPFFWDGRAESLEKQALGPVPNPLEMNLSWAEAISRIKMHYEYPELFYNAFGTYNIDSNHVANAIAQFERTFISANSKWDEFRRSGKEPFEFFTFQEFEGYNIFFTETGDCFHCHGQKEMLTDNLFHNNGLDDSFLDIGLEEVTGNSNDKGKFKTPSLRNVEFTAPYMHDGRFQTLEEVIEHYSFGVLHSSTIDPLMKKVNQGGLQLTFEERQSLIAFLKTFSDTTFIFNPEFSSPF